MCIFYTLPSLLFLPFKAEKDNGHIELENKKLEKESKNEQEREKSENMAKENIPMDSASQITMKGLSNLGNTCFFNAVMQVTEFFLFFPQALKLRVELYSPPMLIPAYSK